MTTRDAHGVADKLARVSGNPIIGFAPWIIFWIVATGPSTWLYGAFAATVAALILAIPDAVRRRPKMLDIGSIVFFIALSVVGLVVSPSDGDALDKYSSVISSGALAVIALASLLFVPFTEQYAREDTPQELWGTPVFKRINRDLTLMWGLVFVASTVSALVAVQVPSTSGWTSWVIPIALLVGAFKFTAWYPDRVTGSSS